MKIVLQKRTQTILLILVLCGVIGLVWSVPQTLVIHTSKGDALFTVEIADTPARAMHGLMFRKELAEDHGMLFLFRPPQDVAMWMKNTLIPLDMIFIRADGTIAYIAENAKPQSLKLIRSGQNVSAVLEIGGGIAKRIGAKPGDRVIAGAYFHE